MLFSKHFTPPFAVYMRPFNKRSEGKRIDKNPRFSPANSPKYCYNFNKLVRNRPILPSFGWQKSAELSPDAVKGRQKSALPQIFLFCCFACEKDVHPTDKRAVFFVIIKHLYTLKNGAKSISVLYYLYQFII